MNITSIRTEPPAICRTNERVAIEVFIEHDLQKLVTKHLLIDRSLIIFPDIESLSVFLTFNTTKCDRKKVRVSLLSIAHNCITINGNSRKRLNAYGNIVGFQSVTLYATTPFSLRASNNTISIIRIKFGHANIHMLNPNKGPRIAQYRTHIILQMWTKRSFSQPWKNKTKLDKNCQIVFGFQ